MVSYFKTQWFRVLCGLTCIIIALVFAFSPSPDTSTLEGTNNAIGIMFASTGWLLSSFIWFGLSFIDWHSERIALLEKKAEKCDALAEEVSALYEANRIDREHMKLLEQKISQLKYDMEGRR